MKIAIIAANNIRVSPYLLFYLDICMENQWETHVFIPDRQGITETIKYGKLEVFKEWDKAKKFSSYLKYARWIQRHIKKQSFDYIISLTALSSVFVSRVLLSPKYKNRYIIDIRDYSYEHIPIFRSIEKKLMKNAALRVISSRKYEMFLPKKQEYMVCHNISFNINQTKKLPYNINKRGIIKIGYVGAVSYENQCYRLIDLVKNDTRFSFEIFGEGISSDLIEKYVGKTNCTRIRCHGAYLPEEKADIIKSVDILFNAYGNDSKRLTCALSNKLYDSFFYGKPILNSPDTYMNELGKQISYAIDFDNEKDLNGLYKWYINIDCQAATRYADSMLALFIQENKETINKIVNLINATKSH